MSDDFRARWSALHGGYDPARSRVVLAWLALVRVLATPLARAGVPPNLLTALAVAAALAAAFVAGLVAGPGAAWAPAAAAGLVLLNGLLDGLDGAVAVLSRRASRLGFLLDSLADRCADGLLLVALWRAGAPPGWAVGAGVALGLLEYARARAGQAGMSEIAVVTVGERPVRVVLAAVGLAVPSLSGAAAATTAGLAAAGFVQFLGVAVRRLAPPPPAPRPRSRSRAGSGPADELGDERRGQRDERQPAAGMRRAADEEQAADRGAVRRAQERGPRPV